MGNKIIDISHWHPVKNWEKAKKDCAVLISKATEGTTYIDPTLKSFIAGCEKHKIPYFLYGFLRRGKELESAKFLIKTCKPLIGDSFVGWGLDIENAGDGTCPTVEGSKEAIKYIQSLGEKTLIYTGYGQYETYKSLVKNLPADSIWWEARYTNKYKPHACDLWQYDEDYKSGFCSSDAVDISKIYSDKITIEWFKKRKNSKTTVDSSKATTKDKENNEELVTAKKVLAIANKEEGYLEKSNSAFKTNPDVIYNKTDGAGNDNITKFNEEMHKIQPRNMDRAAAWCACFVCWCIYEATGRNLEKTKKILCGDIDDYTVQMAENFKKKDRWGSTPEVGAIVFFKNNVRICHVGFVYKIDNKFIYTIEGNTSSVAGVVANGGCVRLKRYARTYNRIAGFGYPKYEDEKETPVKKLLELPTRGYFKLGDGYKWLKDSHTEKQIILLQKFLNKILGTKLTADGDYGEKTVAAVKKFQKKYGLTADGEFGKKSLEKALTLV